LISTTVNDGGYTDGKDARGTHPAEPLARHRRHEPQRPGLAASFDVEAVDGDTVRGAGYWEVRDRAQGDDRADIEAPWGRVPDGMVKPDQFSAFEFGGRFKPLGT
jgi:hypothetical protein